MRRLIAVLAITLTSELLFAAEFHDVQCEGVYEHHLQGICTDVQSIYWCCTTTLVKTDLDGKLLAKSPVRFHHGDLCWHEGKLYIAVNHGKFNDSQGNADSWVYVYNAADLTLLEKHKTPEVIYGAGGIGVHNEHFFVVGGLPEGSEENYVYEYDGQFKFVKKYVVRSGHTKMGIQTATFAGGRWWFGCYGEPRVVLVTDANCEFETKLAVDGSIGIAGLPDGRFLLASGTSDPSTGCTCRVRVARLDDLNSDFQPLFNGRDLTGWNGDLNGYAVEDGCLVCLPNGRNIFTDKEYDDFILRFEFKLTPGANNGIGIRAPRDATKISTQGIELQILDDYAEEYRNLMPYQYHGSVYGFVPATKCSLNPVGEWNNQEIACSRDHITVTVNGKRIIDTDLRKYAFDPAPDGNTRPGIKRSSGHIALLGHTSRVDFRSLRVKSLVTNAPNSK